MQKANVKRKTSNDASDPDRSLPSGGTTRLRALELSGDLTDFGAFSLKVAWQDADLTSSSATYLPVLRDPSKFTMPEFVIPPREEYGVVSFGERHLGWVVRYTLRQRDHHEAGTTIARLERGSE